ncbi:hypothetical protein [Tropicimonas sp. S265A]
MYFLVILILFALLAVCVFMLMKNGTIVLPGTVVKPIEKQDE